ncbi:hypothetical protein [Methylobacterium fujisawaense]
MNGARVKLFELREYVSERTGNTYFSGFLGKAKVVVLRDDRAECTGKEKARWSVLLEEPEPRKAERSTPTTIPADDAEGVNPPYPLSPTPRSPRRQPPMAAADRRAARTLRDQGIDPDSEMPRDEIPF